MRCGKECLLQLIHTWLHVLVQTRISSGCASGQCREQSLLEECLIERVPANGSIAEGSHTCDDVAIMAET